MMTKRHEDDKYKIYINVDHRRVCKIFYPDKATTPKKGRPNPDHLISRFFCREEMAMTKGGSTTVTVIVYFKAYLPQKVTFRVEGLSVCSMSDTYDKVLGEFIAINRCNSTLDKMYYANEISGDLYRILDHLTEKRSKELRNKFANRNKKVAKTKQFNEYIDPPKDIEQAKKMTSDAAEIETLERLRASVLNLIDHLNNMPEDESNIDE